MILFKPHTYLSKLANGRYQLTISMLLPTGFEIYLEENTSDLIFGQLNTNQIEIKLTIARSTQETHVNNGTTKISLHNFGALPFFPIQIAGNALYPPMQVVGTCLFSIQKQLELGDNAEINLVVNIEKETFQTLSEQNLDQLSIRGTTKDALMFLHETERFIKYAKDHLREDEGLLPKLLVKSRDLLSRITQIAARLEQAEYSDPAYKELLAILVRELTQILERIEELAGNILQPTSDNQASSPPSREEILRQLETVLRQYSDRKPEHRVSRLTRNTKGADSTEKEE